jgi:predicted choloylglycine hydrolase
MHSTRDRLAGIISIGLILSGAFLNGPSIAQPHGFSHEEVVAGGPDQFMMVRHVVLEGTNYEIGKKIGEIVSRNGDSGPLRAADQRRTRVLREYMAGNYPVLYERMRGLAEAFGVDIGDDAYDLSALPQFHIFGPGCSAVFYPGGFTEGGHSIMSRNFDFTTGTVLGTRVEGSQKAAVARPYVFEIYPDRGYASISICAFDLLSGVLDGINSQGLTVAIFADDETMTEYGTEPFPGVGFNELMSMRYLLDNCSNAEEAKEAMLYHKHYYSFIPCHYLIGDREGNSFVFGFSPLRNGTFLVEGEGPQCVTNHPVSRYNSPEEFPADSRLSTYGRYAALSTAAEGKERFSLDDIVSINASVAVPPNVPSNENRAPGRTLWHSLYDAEALTLRVKFYLGEKPDPSDATRVLLEYTPYLEFQLEA